MFDRGEKNYGKGQLPLGKSFLTERMFLQTMINKPLMTKLSDLPGLVV